MTAGPIVGLGEEPTHSAIRGRNKGEVGLRKLRVNYDPRYWVLHGKTYDFSDFITSHPAGESTIMLGKGRDCTELFESVHAFIARKATQQLIMAKYEVHGETNKPSTFSWEASGFYSTARRRVRNRFSGRNYKATVGVMGKLVMMAVLYTLCWMQAAWTGNWWWAVGSGLLTEMIGFCLMHDSSHNAVSKIPIVNYAGSLWSSWMFWNTWVWLQHHVYGHHSYTAIFEKDPDIHNAELFLRKHPSTEMRSVYKYQRWCSWIIFLLLPNQHVGQMLLYQLYPAMENRLFGTFPLLRGPAALERDSRVVMGISIIWHVLFPLYYQSWQAVLLLLFVNYTMMGSTYFLNVAPNHDTASSVENHPTTSETIDWGEHQVRTTGNHSVQGTVLETVITHLWGGMNFQVEHHLFPSLNHAHYHEVSLIVQATCKEFDIPYNGSSSWREALCSYHAQVCIMAEA